MVLFFCLSYLFFLVPLKAGESLILANQKGKKCLLLRECADIHRGKLKIAELPTTPIESDYSDNEIFSADSESDDEEDILPTCLSQSIEIKTLSNHTDKNFSTVAQNYIRKDMQKLIDFYNNFAQSNKKAFVIVKNLESCATHSEKNPDEFYNLSSSSDSVNNDNLNNLRSSSGSNPITIDHPELIAAVQENNYRPVKYAKSRLLGSVCDKQGNNLLQILLKNEQPNIYIFNLLLKHIDLLHFNKNNENILDAINLASENHAECTIAILNKLSSDIYWGNSPKFDLKAAKVLIPKAKAHNTCLLKKKYILVKKYLASIKKAISA